MDRLEIQIYARNLVWLARLYCSTGGNDCLTIILLEAAYVSGAVASCGSSSRKRPSRSI
jgi:hypothetical protein